MRHLPLLCCAALLVTLTPCRITAGDFPEVPPTGSPTLTVTKGGGGVASLSWTALPGAQLYDVARGSLNALRATGNFTPSVNNCLQNDRMARTALDAGTPATGDSYWYVIRGVHCDGNGTYDSGNASQVGSRDAGIEASGFCTPAACTPGTDTDADRLDNCYETGTGVYCGPTRTGTSPTLADTDGDNLRDGDELLGTLAGLNLPGLGANALKRDLFLEYDWFNDSVGCAAHSHQPTQAMVDLVTTAFAASPLVNADGTTGVVFHHDRGQGGLFTGGTLVPDADGVLTGDVSSAEFYAIKTANFASNRNGYFHYTLLPHYYNTNSTSSGQAEINGDDLIVSLYCSFSTNNVANTIVHELGHNLNLRHGGNVNCNYKPNYNSVMNYKYQFPGADNNCDPNANGVLDYSRGTRISLNETALNEFAGTCGNPPGPGWDWNGSGGLQNPVSFDINSSDTGQAANCGGTLTTLTDFNDWAAILFTGLNDGDIRAEPREIISCDNPAPLKMELEPEPEPLPEPEPEPLPAPKPTAAKSF